MQKLDETFRFKTQEEFRSRCGDVANQLPDALFEGFGGVAFGAKMRVAHAAMSYRGATLGTSGGKHIAALDEITAHARAISEHVKGLADIFDRQGSVDDVTLTFVMDGIARAGSPVGRKALVEGFLRHALDFAAFETVVATVQSQATAHQPAYGPKKETKLHWLFFVARLACIYEVLGESPDCEDDRVVTGPQRARHTHSKFMKWANDIIKALHCQGMPLQGQNVSLGEDFLRDMNKRLKWKEWPRETKVAYADGVLLGMDKRHRDVADRMQLAN